jgi:ascorbate-specific PTS system EIIC-type component UlaA
MVISITCMDTQLADCIQQFAEQLSCWAYYNFGQVTILDNSRGPRTAYYSLLYVTTVLQIAVQQIAVTLQRRDSVHRCNSQGHHLWQRAIALEQLVADTTFHSSCKITAICCNCIYYQSTNLVSSFLQSPFISWLPYRWLCDLCFPVHGLSYQRGLHWVFSPSTTQCPLL